MAPPTNTSMSNEVLLMVAAGLSITLISAYNILWKDKRRLPPQADDGIFDAMRTLMDSRGAPDFFLNRMNEIGPVYRLRMPDFSNWVVICDPSLARQILTEEVEKPELVKRVAGVTNGIRNIFSEPTHGKYWKVARKGIASSFSIKNILLSLPMMNEKIDQLKEYFLQQEREQATFNLSTIILQLTMDFLCAAMFGIDYGSMTIKNGKGQILINEFQIVIKEYAVKQVFNPFRFLFFWNKEVQRAKIASNEIEKSQIELLQNYRLNKTSDEISKDQSILGHLVRTPYVSEKERCADMTVFMMAGHDSTSNTISWIIVEVSKNKKILQKIQSEINNKINKNDRIITPKILNELSYLEDVIKEGSRLWPVSALGTMRTCSKDRIYKNYIIPKGSILWMPFYAIFRYGIQDPSLFNPERWEPGAPDEEKLKTMYFPFAVGVRSCVGQNLALIEMKLVLASIFRSFEFELQSVVTKDYCLTLKPSNANMKVYSVQ